MLPFRSVKNFYPRPPRGGRPPAVARGYPSAKISIHALREEGDVGGDPALGLFGISIHALREEGDAGPQLRERPERISIHALREEGDEEGPKVFRLKTNFYPRPPRGGRPLTVRLSALPRSFLSTPSARRATVDGPISVQLVEFLSTPSARRATRSFSASISNWRYFYPRPPRGGRHGQRLHEGAGAQISIHALREEGDLYAPRTKLQHLYFYPRPPRGGRPHNAGDGAVHVLISIHALREEGDDVRAGLFCSYGRFLSTPSARRATPADLRG